MVSTSSFFLLRQSDLGLFKAEVLKRVLNNRFPKANIEVITDSETFKNPCSYTQLWETMDVIISTIDEYHTVISLVDKAIETKVPMIVIDAPKLTITTHSLIPYIETEKDMEKYRQSLLQKKELESINLNSMILNFPTQVNHCILWAKSIFTLFFTTFYYSLLDFGKNPAKLLEEMETQQSKFAYELHIIEIIKYLYLQKTKRDFGSCVDLAIELFMELFNLDILAIIQNHPADSKNPDGQTSFWEDKRFPEPVKPIFESTDSSSYQFVLAVSMLFAQIFLIVPPTEDIVAKMIEEKMKLEFKEEYINDFEKAPVELTASEKIQTFKQQLKNSILNEVKLSNPIDIHDSRQHALIVSFIHAASSLRCQNFKLPGISRHRVEEMVYNIKPNLNSSSAIASSLASLDLLKLVSVKKVNLGHQQGDVRCSLCVRQPRTYGMQGSLTDSPVNSFQFLLIFYGRKSG